MKVEAFFFENGNVAVFDRDGGQDGEQASELQGSWFLKYVYFLEEKGVDVLNSKFNLPGGRVARVFQTPEKKLNWELLH